jgi:hypothetical protein
MSCIYVLCVMCVVHTPPSYDDGMVELWLQA